VEDGKEFENGESARARGGVVALGFFERVLGAVFVSEHLSLFVFGFDQQKAFDRVDDAGGGGALVCATQASHGAPSMAHGLYQRLGAGLCSLRVVVGNDALFEALRVASISDVAGIVDRGYDLGRGEQGFLYLHGRNYTAERLLHG